MMNDNQSSPLPAGVRMFEVEQAAHALRQRLAMATSQSNTPLTSFIDTFKDLCRASSHNPRSPSPSEQSHPHAQQQEQDVCGLGISTTMMSETARAEAKHPPSLNDLLFRPMLDTTATSTTSNGNIRVHPNGSKSAIWQRRSPHVRQGSSAFLEQVAVFSPKLASSDGFDVDRLPSGTPKLVSNPRHARNRSDALSTPHLISFTSPGRRLSHEFDGQTSALAHRRRRPSSQLARRRERSVGATTGSTLPNGHPASSLAQDLGLASGGLGRPARSRQSSSHAALRSSVGEDLDESMSDGGVAPQDPELLASMMLAGLASSDMHGQAANQGTPTSTARRHSTFVNPNEMATPRKRQKSVQAQLLTPTSVGRSVLADSIADLDVSMHAGSGSNEAAAHSLLDLASSPSPMRSSTARFPGYTPSLRFDDGIAQRRSSNGMSSSIQYRLTDEIDKHEATRPLIRSPPSLRAALQAVGGHRTSGRGHARTGSLGSHGVTDAGSPFRMPAHRTPESSKLSSSLHPATPPSSVEARSPIPHATRGVRIMSPPMTPPRSEEARARSKTEQGDRHGSLRFTSPETPSRRRGSLRLVSEVDDEQDEEDAHELANTADEQTSRDSSVEKKAEEISRDSSMDDFSMPSTPPPPHHATTKNETMNATATETPRTPPHAPNTPKTPKAPGSNFSYGDFLHVSPSPQPRMRAASHHGGLLTGTGGRLDNGMATMPFSVTETPTRGTRSRARFLAFDGGEDADDERMTTFTVGPLTNITSAKGVNTLGEAFEHLSQRDENNDAIPKSGKRSARVLHPSPSILGPKRRRSTATLQG